MRETDLLHQLVRHAEWADATIWKTALGTLDEESKGLDSKIEYWLHHIHVVQHAFPRVWQGQPLEFPEIGDFDDPRAIARWGREGHAELQRYVTEADDAELGRVLQLPWAEELTEKWRRPISPVTLAQSATQVTSHSTHHRGQVASRLREVGAEPPMVDYIAWLWFGQPEAEWP
jgi:uncharacterized damage-inducible protein DinB